tara:strand:+ start:4661 stop:6937 length:2277 start_codon:yes stop_codon:yes gene_type:complete
MSQKNKSRKMPLSPDEKLWRRISVKFGNNKELWNRIWNSNTIYSFIIEKEKLRLNNKESKQLKSKIDEILAHSKKGRQWFLHQEKTNFTLRKLNEISEIEASVRNWRHFFNSYSPTEDIPLTGQLPSKETTNYNLIEDVWFALISNEKLPEEFSLSEKEYIVKWRTYDLIEDAKIFATTCSGLRFRDYLPSIALLLIKSKRISASQLLDLRLNHLRINGSNSFGRDYDSRLSDIAERIPDVDANNALKNGRTDLRHLPFVTIDPKTAKDFDDAICLVEEKGKQTLWVAIADVAHYIKPDTLLDEEAQARATSVYLPHAVLPMLPSRLADNLCSLRAKVPRLAMAVSMQIEDDWTVGKVAAFESIIEVRENLSYEDALDNPRFKNMMDLAQGLRQNEIRLNLNSAELRPKVEDDKISVNVKWPNKATEMIETFMVTTNNSIGIMLGKENAPLPWRSHAPPDSPEVEELNAKFEAMGINIELPMPSVKKFGQSEEAELASMLGDWANSGNIQISGLEISDDDEVPQYLKNVLDPEARKDILISLKEAQEKASNLKNKTRRVVDHGLFYLLQRAVYSPDNLGHFGLNLDAYVHFTSPIRRYADLVVHRQLKSFLKEEEWVHSEAEITKISEQCTANSREAKTIEWELVANAFHLHLLRGGTIDSIKDSDDVLELKQWPARVVGLRNPWIFLDLLDDGAIRGKLHVSQLGDGRRLSTDEFGLTLIDENVKEFEKIVLSLGQKFACRLRGLDLWSGELDLAPV